MYLDPVEVKAFYVVVIILAGLYFWVRRNNKRTEFVRENKRRCKDLILDNRRALAEAGADFAGLVSLVKMHLNPDQLELVIRLLTARDVQYNVDSPEDPDCLEVNLDFEDGQDPVKVTPAIEEGEEEDLPEVFEKMDPEQEKVWFRVAHNRFRRALAEKEISLKHSKLKLLVKMVELGKKAVEDDPDKPVSRREYECSLWDRFYENEYLELNYE